MLDKSKKRGYNGRALGTSVIPPLRARKFLKKIKKLSKKVLTRKKRYGIIVELSTKKGRRTVIEN